MKATHAKEQKLVFAEPFIRDSISESARGQIIKGIT
jgi:hypothetical protein